MSELTLETIHWAISQSRSNEEQSKVSRIFSLLQCNPKNISFIIQLLSEGPDSLSCFFGAASGVHMFEIYGSALASIQREEVDQLFQICLELIASGMENEGNRNQVVNLISHIIKEIPELITNVMQFPYEILIDILLFVHPEEETFCFLRDAEATPKWVLLLAASSNILSKDLSIIDEFFLKKLEECTKAYDCSCQFYTLIETIFSVDCNNLSEEEKAVIYQLIIMSANIIQSIMSNEHTEEDVQKCIGIISEIIDFDNTMFNELEEKDGEFAHAILNLALDMCEAAKEIPSELPDILRDFTNPYIILYIPITEEEEEEEEEREVKTNENFAPEFYRYLDFLFSLAACEENTEDEDAEIVYHTSGLFQAISDVSMTLKNSEALISQYIQHLPEFGPAFLYIVAASAPNIQKMIASQVADNVFGSSDLIEYEIDFFSNAFAFLKPEQVGPALQRVWNVFLASPTKENAMHLQKICYLCPRIMAEDTTIQDTLIGAELEQGIIPYAYMIISYPLILMSDQEAVQRYVGEASQLIVGVCGAIHEEGSVRQFFKFLFDFVSAFQSDISFCNEESKAFHEMLLANGITEEQQNASIAPRIKELTMQILEELGEEMLNPENVEYIVKFLFKALNNGLVDPPYVIEWGKAAFERSRAPCLYSMLPVLMRSIPQESVFALLEMNVDDPSILKAISIMTMHFLDKMRGNQEFLLGIINQERVIAALNANNEAAKFMMDILSSVFGVYLEIIPLDTDQICSTVIELMVSSYNASTIKFAIKFLINNISKGIFNGEAIKEYFVSICTDESDASYMIFLFDEAINDEMSQILKESLGIFVSQLIISKRAPESEEE